MWDAAPAAHTRVAVATLAAIVWLCTGATAHGAVETKQPATPIWAAELTNGQAKALTVLKAYELQRAGVTAVILDRSRLDRRSREHAQYLADLLHLLVIDASARSSVQRCNAKAGKTACALVAGSVKQGIALAKLRGKHLIVVHVKSAAEVQKLAAVRSRGRFVALGRLGARDGFSLAGWQAAVRLASASAGLHLGAAAGTSTATVSHYFAARAKVSAGTPGSAPTSGPAAAPAASPPASGDSGVAKLPTTSGSASPTPAPVAAPPASVISGAANLFIDSDGGTCTRSGSLVAYNTATACSTFKNAYIAASLGDTVRIKCGTYASETINGVSTSKGSPDSVFARVAFHPENDTLGCVSINGNLQVDVPHVEFHKVSLPTGSFGCAYRTDASQTKGGNCHLIGSDVASVTLLGIFNFRIAGNDIGETRNRDGIEIGDYPQFSGHHPRNGVIEDNYIHDQTLDLTCGGTSPCDPHIDALQLTTGEDVIVRRNTFRGGQQAILAQPDAGPINRITLENNLIIDYTGGFSVWLKNKAGQTCGGNIINYNTSDREFSASSVAAEQCSGSMTGNLWPSISAVTCNTLSQSWSISYLVVASGTTCGSNGYMMRGGWNAAFINTASNNYHLSASSEARGKGNPLVCPTLDVDGDARHAGSVCDAGSDDVQ